MLIVSYQSNYGHILIPISCKYNSSLDNKIAGSNDYFVMDNRLLKYFKKYKEEISKRQELPHIYYPSKIVCGTDFS